MIGEREVCSSRKDAKAVYVTRQCSLTTNVSFLAVANNSLDSPPPECERIDYERMFNEAPAVAAVEDSNVSIVRIESARFGPKSAERERCLTRPFGRALNRQSGPRLTW